MFGYSIACLALFCLAKLFVVRKTGNYHRKHAHEGEREDEYYHSEYCAALHHAVDLIYYFFKHYQSVVDVITERRREEERGYYWRKLPAGFCDAQAAGERAQKQHYEYERIEVIAHIGAAVYFAIYRKAVCRINYRGCQAYNAGAQAKIKAERFIFKEIKNFHRCLRCRSFRGPLFYRPF